MARPRLHDLDALLDAAELLFAEGGSGALTIRALAERTGAPSGSLYHAFGSRNELLGRMWLRAANRFLDLQRTAVSEHLGEGAGYDDDAVAATVAAASTPAALAAQSPATAKLLLEHRRETIVDEGLPEPLTTELQALDDQLLQIMRTLASALFGRRDRRAIETVTACIVDLPTALLSSRHKRAIDPLTILEAAVRGVLTGAASEPSSTPGRA